MPLRPGSKPRRALLFRFYESIDLPGDAQRRLGFVEIWVHVFEEPFDRFTIAACGTPSLDKASEHDMEFARAMMIALGSAGQ